MSVKDFLPLGDVKLTTEKEVPRKPTIAELTTVESPGRPSPASMLENNSPKKGNRKRKSGRNMEKLKNVKVSEPKKDSILIITEKPQSAMKIAFALGKARKTLDFSVPYYELERNGKEILVASAVGHLFNLTYSQGQKGWPIFNLEWVPSHEKKSSFFTKKYLDLLRKLSRKAKEIIIATDFDIEGEVIGWNVLRFIFKKNTAKRMKYSTLTAGELQKSYENLLPELAWGNAYAGETRHYLDWLYGINLSRALMSAIKKTGSFKILSIGRVQGPALKIIVDREKEISSFKSEPYWQVFALCNELEFKHPQDIFDKSILDLFKDIKSAIATTKKFEDSLPPPVPFDLTTLQREAFRLYRMSPAETLSVSQKLYLDGLISYPRTSSQKIPSAIVPKKILKALEPYFPEAADAKRQIPIEGKKSDPAHPSIYPTGEFAHLSGREEKLYNLIAKRFIAAFSDDAITANKRIVLTALDSSGNPLKIKFPIKEKSPASALEDDESDEINKKEIGNADNISEATDYKDNYKEKIVTFTGSGLTILKKGWTSFYPIKILEQELPDIEGIVKIDKIKNVEKETMPPPRFTSASLVSLLEKKNLGTKATRSMIIETLFSRGYLDGRSISATPLGLKLIEALEKYSPIIIDEDLTRQLEEEMEKIQLSLSNHENMEKEVIEKAKRLIMDISKELKVHEMSIGNELLKGIESLRLEQQLENTLMQCPKCKLGMLRILYSKKTRRYFVACSKYPDCNQTFSLPPNALIKKAENKMCPADNFPKLLAIKKGRRPWEFCFNPLCPIEKQKREEWESKKQEKMQNKENNDLSANG